MPCERDTDVPEIQLSEICIHFGRPSNDHWRDRSAKRFQNARPKVTAGRRHALLRRVVDSLCAPSCGTPDCLVAGRVFDPGLLDARARVRGARSPGASSRAGFARSQAFSASRAGPPLVDGLRPPGVSGGILRSRPPCGRGHLRLRPSSTGTRRPRRTARADVHRPGRTHPIRQTLR